MTTTTVLSMEAFMWPILERLKARGRSLNNPEMLDDVPRHTGISEETRRRLGFGLIRSET